MTDFSFANEPYAFTSVGSRRRTISKLQEILNNPLSSEDLQTTLCIILELVAALNDDHGHNGNSHCF